MLAATCTLLWPMMRREPFSHRRATICEKRLLRGIIRKAELPVLRFLALDEHHGPGGSKRDDAHVRPLGRCSIRLVICDLRACHESVKGCQVGGKWRRTLLGAARLHGYVTHGEGADYRERKWQTAVEEEGALQRNAIRGAESSDQLEDYERQPNRSCNHVESNASCLEQIGGVEQAALATRTACTNEEKGRQQVGHGGPWERR
mmetsp:Transcript_79227/g.232639  ORF Transcript_79227/g.232639 Transcript_79227/m.232639 type:complete len:204 (+) Transcript_79227:1106-1717(+)